MFAEDSLHINIQNHPPLKLFLYVGEYFKQISFLYKPVSGQIMFSTAMPSTFSRLSCAKRPVSATYPTKAPLQGPFRLSTA